MQECGSRTEIADNENRLFDILFFQMGEKEIVKAVGQAETIMPEGIDDEDEKENEETFRRKPAWGSFRFEKTDINGLEKKFDVWNHWKWSIITTTSDMATVDSANVRCLGDKSLPKPELLYLSAYTCHSD